MGQVALGFRSLFIKLAIFFVMAALLAWALGGTLWPRAESANLPSVTFNGNSWHWRVEVGGREPDSLNWTLMHRSQDDGDSKVFDETHWKRAAGPVVAGDSLYYAGSMSFDDAASWTLVRVSAADADGWIRTPIEVADRLAVEQELHRLRVGLSDERSGNIETSSPRGLNHDRPTADDEGPVVIPPE
jgi:hypothetical protein